jgi:hypothetical protein
MFYCASTNSMDSCPKAEPREQRGLTLYTLASRLQKQKARSNPYMVVFNFIGYFTLVLCGFLLPGATWPSSCSDFSGFISLSCHPYLPATFSGLRLRLFFLSSSLLHQYQKQRKMCSYSNNVLLSSVPSPTDGKSNGTFLMMVIQRVKSMQANQHNSGCPELTVQ